MVSSSSLGIGLGLAFGVLVLAFVAEMYYLLRWKKRISNGEIKDDDDYNNTSTKELFYLSCWKKPSLISTNLHSQSSQEAQDAHVQLHSNSSKDVLVKSFGEDDIEAELKRLHNLSGPARILFTINEETKEDLESDDGRSRDGRSRKGSRGRSLSDFLFKVDTPFMSPLASPQVFTPPRTPKGSNNGFNPLFESSTDAEVTRIRSSPPPKFKFLKDAEEKLYRRILIEEAQKRLQKNGGAVEVDKIKGSSPIVTREQDGSFISITIDKNMDREVHHHSSASQVLPLASSPSTTSLTNIKTHLPLEVLELQRLK